MSLDGFRGFESHPLRCSAEAASTAPDGWIARIDVKSPSIDSGPTETLRAHDATFTYSGGAGMLACDCSFMSLGLVATLSASSIEMRPWFTRWRSDWSKVCIP